MKPEKKVISWKELADLERAMVPPHVVFQLARCENCGHELERHYKYNAHSKQSYGHAVQRMRCLNGKCECPGIKIQGRLIEDNSDFVSSEKVS